METNCVINSFTYEAWTEEADLPVHMAIVPSRAQYEDMIGRGINGFQPSLAVLPYTRTNIHFRVGVIVEKDGGGLWYLPFSRRDEKRL